MNNTLDKILVPLDGSRMAESVLPVTSSLARCLGATISLLHIIEEHAPQHVHGEPHLTASAQAETYLDGIAEKLEASGAKIEKHVHGTEEGDVAASIAAHVAELGVGMVALCTHGRSDLRRVLIGSIAQQVLRRVTVPTLLMRPNIVESLSFRTIMVPLDGSAGAEACLPTATEIARRCGASLKLVRVVPTVTTLTGDQSAAARLIPLSTSVTLDAQETDAEKYLDGIAAQLAQQGVHTQVEVRRGETEKMLAEAAEQEGIEVVVIATHARSGIGAIWTGSVAAGLIDKLRQPLLLVRIAE